MQTQSEMRDQISRFVGLIVVLLLVMALSFVAIGALSLIGAMSLNVIERTKEIGILRALGSSHGHITSIVVIEGACIGLMSWVPATILALPLGRALSDVLGWSIVSWPLVYVFPPVAPLLCGWAWWRCCRRRRATCRRLARGAHQCAQCAGVPVGGGWGMGDRGWGEPGQAAGDSSQLAVNLQPAAFHFLTCNHQLKNLCVLCG